MGMLAKQEFVLLYFVHDFMVSIGGKLRCI
jgi:hypothetical protein